MLGLTEQLAQAKCFQNSQILPADCAGAAGLSPGVFWVGAAAQEPWAEPFLGWILGCCSGDGSWGAGNALGMLLRGWILPAASPGQSCDQLTPG